VKAKQGTSSERHFLPIYSYWLQPGSIIYPIPLNLMTTARVNSLYKHISKPTNFNPEDGGSIFIRNISIHPQNYKILQSMTTALTITAKVI
jgi:hypothetical protein